MQYSPLMSVRASEEPSLIQGCVQWKLREAPTAASRAFEVIFTIFRVEFNRFSCVCVPTLSCNNLVGYWENRRTALRERVRPDDGPLEGCAVGRGLDEYHPLIRWPLWSGPIFSPKRASEGRKTPRNRVAGPEMALGGFLECRQDACNITSDARNTHRWYPGTTRLSRNVPGAS
jgi:hypothetical protein